MQAGVMPSALGKRHLRWLIAVRPRGTIERISKIEIGISKVVWMEVGATSQSSKCNNFYEVAIIRNINA